MTALAALAIAAASASGVPAGDASGVPAASASGVPAGDASGVPVLAGSGSAFAVSAGPRELVVFKGTLLLNEFVYRAVLKLPAGIVRLTLSSHS